MTTQTWTTAAPAIELRPIQFRDLGDVVRLERRSFGADAWGWLDFLIGFVLGNIFVKAVQDERLVGFVLAQTHRRQSVTWILNVAVAPENRNQGIGRHLMQAAEERATTRQMRLTVRVDNESARHLYHGLGYRDATLRRGYYGRGRDGLEMLKELP